MDLLLMSILCFILGGIFLKWYFELDRYVKKSKQDKEELGKE